MNNTWKIFVNGQPTVERAVVHELEYHGEWMEEEYVSVTVKSATPIDFHYGDHLYYRGVKFEINYDPNFIKKASSGSYGEGFTYDNIKLYPVSARLKDVAFKDVVLNDPQTPANAIVYSSLGTFSFFAGSVEDLADRIMANLNRDYNGEWRVYTPYKARSIQRNGSIGAWGQYYNGDGGTIEGKTEMNIECQNLSVLDALKLAYTSFDLSFYVTGKVIVIGGKPIVADYEFEYGKGNGLYEIERTHDESQRIVTKLYAYGSDRNLPLNYYANIGKKVKIPIVHKTKREILQGNPELVLWVNKEFTKSLRDAFGPNYEVKLTYGNLSARFGVSGDTYTYAQEQDDDTLNHTTEYMMFWALSDNTDALAFYNAIAAGASVYVTGVNINQMPSDFIETPSSYSYDAALSITKLMLPGFPTQSLFAWVAANGAININYITGRATWHGYTAYFSMDASDPWIKSVKADEIGVREGTVEFDSSSDTEIYPTIEGTGFDKVNWCEQIDDNGHIDEELTFKLMPQSVDGSDGDIEWDYGGVSISMKDGYCVGREFEVAEAKFNTDTSLWELTMKRKKDDSLGVYFPYKSGSGNLYQILGSGNLHDPDQGDHFVVLGIPLPSTYVNLAASKLLEEALKELAKIDHQSYTYIPRIDEIEMARQHDLAMASQGTITSIHDTICAGMQMQIDDDDLNLHYTPFIDNITIKEAGNNGIPTYDVVLRAAKEMTMQQRIQSQIDGGKDAVINALGGEGGEWLSRVSDDTAQGMITFLRGLQVGENFVTGLLGEGGVFRVEDDGTTYIEADKLYIRMKAYFDSVEIREYHHTGGNRIASVAGARCCRVEWIDADGNVLEKTQANLSSVVKFRCYFMGNDGDDEVRNNWVVGDLAYCHITTVQTDDDSPEAKGLNMKHYWRKVVGRNATGTLTVKGEHWIDLSNVSGEFQSGSDIPEAQDDIIQLGNVSDTDRQGAIIEFVTGADAPSYQIFQGINSFSLTGKNYVRFGYDSQSGGAQAYIGNPDGSTYLWYHRVTEGGVTFPRLDIKANVKFTSPTTHQETNIEDFATAVTDSIEDLQEQIDGEIDTWFYEGTPTLNNAPASSWTTATEKERHLGDLYYDIGTGATGGFAYRFIKDENNVYQWQYIEDTAITEALAKAAEAYDLADHKRRVFYVTPTPPYDNGDLWVNAVWPDSGASQGSTYNDDILRCVTSKAAGGTFAIGDWTLASNYTDDSALVDFVTNTYAQDLANIETQVDAKAETWYQDSDPSSSWNTDDKKAAHVGDIWYDTSANGGKKTYIWRDRGAGQSPRYYWAEQAVPDVVFDDIDGKAAIYVTWGAWVVDGVSQLNEKDLFIPSADVTPTGSSVTYYANKVYRCTNASTPTFQEIRYTDDTTVDYIINSYGNILGISSPTAQNVGEALGFLRQVLGGSTAIDGGLVLTNLIAMKDTASTPNIWGGISGMYKTSETGTTWKGHGIASWYGGAMVDKECLNATQIAQGWSTHRWARSLNRFDGSGYVADSNISWDKEGNVTIQGYIINATTLQMGGSNVVTETVLANYYTKTEADARYVTIDFFKRLFQAYSSETIIDANKVNPNDLTTTISNIKAMFGLWTESYLSALGLNSSSSSGGLDEEAMWTALWNDTGTYGGRQINASHLTYVLGDYATKAWVQQQISGITGTVTGVSVNNGNPISPVNGIVPLTNIVETTGATMTGTLSITGNTSHLSVGGNIGNSGNITSQGNITGASIIKTGGTSAQFLKADGSVDSSTYLTSIPQAATGTIGGIKVKAATAATPTLAAGSTADRYYGLQIDGNGVAFVNVPWTDNNDDTKNTAGSTARPSNTALYLVGASAQATYGQTYSDSGCYISADGYLYSGGVRVLTSGNTVQTISINNGTPISPTNGNVNISCLTSISSSDITTALGYTPANGSNYLPLSGGTMTGIIRGNGIDFQASGTTQYKEGIRVFTSSDSSDNNATISVCTPNLSSIISMVLNETLGKYRFDISKNGTLYTLDIPSKSGTIAVTSDITDTKNTAGATAQPNSAIYLVGAGSYNSTYATTYTNSGLYISADGYLNCTQRLFMDGVDVLYANNTTKLTIIACGEQQATIQIRPNAMSSDVNCTTFSPNGNVGIGTTLPATKLDVNGNITATAIIKRGGTSAQFLKADGSVDSLSYSTTDTLNTAGSTEQPSGVLLYLVGASAQAVYGQTYSNSGCYIGTDGYLYSGGLKVLTSLNTSYLPLSGGNMTGDVNFIYGSSSRIHLYADSEGGNIKLYSSDSYKIQNTLAYWEMDTHEGVYRFYGRQSDGNWITYKFQNNGTATCVLSGTTPVTKTFAYQDWVQSQGYVTTDTLNTTGSSNHTGQTMYIVGALQQATSTVTYSDSKCYISADGYLGCAGRFYMDSANVLYANNSGKLTILACGEQQATIQIRPNAMSSDVNCTTFSSNGNVGIGKTSPSYKLDINGSMMCTGLNSSGGGSIATDLTVSGHVYTPKIGNGMTNMRFETNGNVGIGVQNTSGYLLQVNGACAGTSWTNLSDMRQKNYVEDESIELWQVAGAPMFKFTWKNPQFGADLHVGSSAQYWQTIVPEAVTTDGLGNLGLQYDVVALLAAITTAKKVQDHENRIQTLERENAALRNELRQLRAA